MKKQMKFQIFPFCRSQLGDMSLVRGVFVIFLVEMLNLSLVKTEHLQFPEFGGEASDQQVIKMQFLLEL